MRTKRMAVLLLVAFLFLCGSVASAASSVGARNSTVQKSVDTAGGTFFDPFDTFDTARWLKSAHTLGRTTFLPENITVEDGYLRIKLPAGTLTGGEIESVDYYGYGTYTPATKKLPFDPTHGFHDYSIVYKPNRVEFYVDGKLFQAWRGGITDQPMKLLLNVWYPTWLEGKPPAADQFLFADWISWQR